jgi:hypothetical protein
VRCSGSGASHRNHDLNSGQDLVGETLRCALEALAVAAEEWLSTQVTAQWAERYGRAVRYDRLPKSPDALALRVEQTGTDGMAILRAVYADDAPPHLRRVAAVQVLRRVWVQQYWTDSDGRLCWRGPKDTTDRQSRRDMPRRTSTRPGTDGRPDPDTARVPWSGMEIVTPHDPEARFSRRLGRAEWTGYRVHQTETCDSTGPNVLVHVLTTPAPEQDVDAIDLIHAGLSAQNLLPVEHLVDGGYSTPATIHRAATAHSVSLVGPVREDLHAAQRPGFAKEDFTVDWDQHTLTCPRGNTSPPWKPARSDGQPRISVLFPRATCRNCNARHQCTGNTQGRGRQVLLMPRPLQEIQSRFRAEQRTDAWRRHHAPRIGCEATVSETVRAHGLRNCRYRGHAKTHVQHVLTAAGTNLIRLSGCLPPGTTPARTPRPDSQFRQLCDRRFPLLPQ